MTIGDETVRPLLTVAQAQEQLRQQLQPYESNLEELIRGLEYPCAICGQQYKDHGLGQLNDCFKKIPAALTAARRAGLEEAISLIQQSMNQSNEGLSEPKQEESTNLRERAITSEGTI